MDTVETSLMRIFRDGPEVSLNGSPTVSPMTAALWHSEPLPPCSPDSMYFLALSQAPPALDIKTAMAKPVTVPPPSRPTTASGPRMQPVTMGTTMASSEGTTISCSAPRVHRSTQEA